MTDYRRSQIIISQELENGRFHGEAFLFLEVSRLEPDRRRLELRLTAELGEIIKDLDPTDLHQRHWVSLPEVGEVHIELDPPRRSVAWRRPVDLRFHVVRWNHGGDAEIALVPALGIEVVASRGEDLLELVRREIRFALLRRKFGSLSLRRKNVPRRRSVKARSPRCSRRSPTGSAAGNRPVGKTACFLELVRRARDFGLEHTEFFQTSGSRLVAGQSGFGMWQERCLKFCREASGRRATLHLGNLVEVMEVGKSQHNQLTAGVIGCLVQTTNVALGRYEPPAEFGRRGFLGQFKERRRLYRLDRKSADDSVVEEAVTWNPDSLGQIIRELAERQLIQAARSRVGL